MAHIRLDDKRIELSMGEPRVRTGGAVLLPALGTAIAPVDWEYPTIGGNGAVLSTEAPMLATLEIVTEGVSKARVRTAVRFRDAKVIFRSEPEIVDADRATDLLVIQDC